MAVTIERYMAVCHPFKAKSTFTCRKATCTAVCIVFFSVLYNLPRWWEYQLLEVYDPAIGKVGQIRLPVLHKVRAIEAGHAIQTDRPTGKDRVRSGTAQEATIDRSVVLIFDHSSSIRPQAASCEVYRRTVETQGATVLCDE